MRVAPTLNRPARIALTSVFVVSTAVSMGWLAIGVVVAAARYVPAVASAVASAAADGSTWARAIAAAAPHSEPPGQAVLDYAFSAVNLVLAAVLLLTGVRTWSIRLLAIAVVSSAGALNLQADAATRAVEAATGLSIGGLHQTVLPVIACSAYLLALLVFPTPPWFGPPGGRRMRTGLVVTGAVAALLVGLGTARLPHTTSFVLFWGFLLPAVGLPVLARRVRRSPTGEQRAQSRLLFSVLVAAFAVAAVLAVVTLLMSVMGDRGLMLVDPTAGGPPGGQEQPALLFWFSRLASAAIAVAALVAMRRDDLWATERLFSRGLATTLVVAGVGGGFVVVRTVATHVVPPWLAATVATVAAGLAFGALYVRAERTVDRLLYGTRPTPYSALADIAALTRSTATDTADLPRVAEAVARVLGAETCRLTVLRSGLRDRTYEWTSRATALGPDDLIELPIHHTGERIGAIAVDRQAVAGLHDQRRDLLEDIADGLGVVLQANRSRIELERQLRAALAHAEEIAVSRRRAVAEMDSERRRIERDLHDGAQHHLVSLGLTLGLLEHQTSSGPLDDARDCLEMLTEQLGTAEAVLAKTVNGVSSLVREEQGLVAALESELGAAHPPVAFDAGGLPPDRRFPAEIEAAVWFCCAEAVGNALKHGGGRRVTVRLAERAGVLTFTVRDEGPGFATMEGADGTTGRGLRNLTTRIAAVGGTMSIRSAPGEGTTVEGAISLPGTAASPSPSTSRAAPAPRPVADGAIPLPAMPTRASPPPTVDSTRPALAAEPPRGESAALGEQVRDVARRACGAYRGTSAQQQMDDLARRLDEPVRIAVLGVADDDRQAIVEALVGAPLRRPARQGAPTPIWYTARSELSGTGGDPIVTLPVPALRTRTVVDLPIMDCPDRARALLGAPGGAPAVDAVVLLLRYGRLADLCMVNLLHAAGHRGAVGVLLWPDGAATSADGATRAYRDDPAIRSVCQIVLARRSGLAELREVVEALFVGRGDALRTRSVLSRLEAIVRSAPPGADGARELRFELERIRSGAHELREIELLGVLRSGDVPLPEDARRAAERLLGVHGRDVPSRLGLGSDATAEQLRTEAARQPARWRALAMHPVASKRVREAAHLLVRTSEELMVQVCAPAASHDPKLIHVPGARCRL